MRRLIGRFLRNDGGATAIEYGLICALIFVAIITSFSALANTQNGGLAVTMEKLTTAMKAAVGN
ncbi:MAG: Flp family type IVb pilin [Brevundimonas sp.]|uniref:Flp family type IVb pilin n=1 Tax=Brevundimonas sp. TaxID=1871086 RepID=UPI00391D73C8